MKPEASICKSEIKIIKKYVNVTVEFLAEGGLRPLWVTWEDGRRFEVDRVLDCRRAASLKAGGTGIRYTCQISGGRHFLFLEDHGPDEGGAWFVECRVAPGTAEHGA